MPYRLFFTLPVIVVAAAALGAAEAVIAPTAPTERTVHVTVTDGKGEAVPDLTAADLVVKEGGKEREITRAEPARGRMRLVLALEEGLMADGSIRLGAFNFVKRVAGAAEISLVAIGLSNRTVVPFTTDPNLVLDAINKATLNPVRDTNLSECVLEIVNQFAASKAERPVLVLVALAGGQAGVNPRSVLDKVGESGVTMHAVSLETGQGGGALATLADQSGREQLLGDGPKQSGGRRIDITTTSGVPKALEQIAGDLAAQYAITYTLPDGVKPNKRFAVSAKRRGVTLRAPSVIPER